MSNFSLTILCTIFSFHHLTLSFLCSECNKALRVQMELERQLYEQLEVSFFTNFDVLVVWFLELVSFSFSEILS